MSPAQKAANRRVIDAAKQVERAAQYGTNTAHAHDAYTQARNELTEFRGAEHRAVRAA